MIGLVGYSADAAPAATAKVTAAAARMMTNRLERQIAWSVVFAALSAALGYVLAGYGPLWLGLYDAVSAAGMIATVSGVILALAARFGPCRTRAGAPAGV